MYSRILVPVDGSPTAERGLAEAIGLAARLGSSLHLLNVVDARLLFAEVSAYAPPDQLIDEWKAAGQRLVDAAVAAARAKGVAAQGVVRCDPGMRVCDMILEEARQSGAELIVMGTHGRSGLAHALLGSVAERVVQHAPCPVLIVPKRPA